MPESDSRIRLYRRSVRASFFLVLFLVLVGGIVRSSGSGMGCPDWPRCFGSWIPPTHADQIPESYYSNPLSSKDGVLVFNVYKTWTEYVNRLIGVLIGFSLMVQMALAFWSGAPFSSKVYSFAAFVLVLFEGWLGAKVVSSDLLPVVITIHLIGAVLIGLALVSALNRLNPHKDLDSLKGFSMASFGIFVILIIQFFMGTKVRGQVDVLFKKYYFGMRHLYIGELDFWFLVHRSFSIVVVLLLTYQFIQLRKKSPDFFKVYLLSPLLICLGIIFSGVLLNYFGFPAFAQPLHLTLGFAILCAQYWIWLQLKNSTTKSYDIG